MAILRREPRNIFDYMQQEFNKLNDNYPLTKADDNGNVVTSDWAPAVDIKEEDTRYLITADIPGVKPDEIEVHMEDGILSIKGERESQKREERESYKRIERNYGVFYRRFNMPDNADPEKIAAKSEHGVLEISIPKKEAAQARKISVTH
ncbi:MAG: Hsp20/alpha crystallin family protein [Gammaproteobacteria bacterium]|nr:Hsp20/alpha crystallin family protein [Gammaproteobacteria bacterium]